jgi:hypothetical protein
MKFTPPTSLKLDDDKADRVRRDISSKVAEIQQQPFTGAAVLSDVELKDTITTKVPHKLGKRPTWIGISVIRGSTTPGVITESARDDKYVTLVANGYGATVAVDLAVL